MLIEKMFRVDFFTSKTKQKTSMSLKLKKKIDQPYFVPTPKGLLSMN